MMLRTLATVGATAPAASKGLSTETVRLSLGAVPQNCGNRVRCERFLTSSPEMVEGLNRFLLPADAEALVNLIDKKCQGCAMEATLNLRLPLATDKCPGATGAHWQVPAAFAKWMPINSIGFKILPDDYPTEPTADDNDRSMINGRVLHAAEEGRETGDEATTTTEASEDTTSTTEATEDAVSTTDATTTNEKPPQDTDLSRDGRTEYTDEGTQPEIDLPNSIIGYTTNHPKFDGCKFLQESAVPKSDNKGLAFSADMLSDVGQNYVAYSSPVFQYGAIKVPADSELYAHAGYAEIFLLGTAGVTAQFSLWGLITTILLSIGTYALA